MKNGAAAEEERKSKKKSQAYKNPFEKRKSEAEKVASLDSFFAYHCEYPSSFRLILKGKKVFFLGGGGIVNFYGPFLGSTGKRMSMPKPAARLYSENI